MVTEWIVPSAAARTASRPRSAPVGARTRAPACLARSTRSQFANNCPTLSGMNIFASSITDSATGRNRGLGRDNGNALADARQIAPRLVAVAHRNGGKNQSGNAAVQPPRHAKADRAQSSYSDL